MANNTDQMMAYANNAIITTKLLRCNRTVNLPQIVQNLYDLYQNTISNVFYNISIINFECNTPVGSYFEQIITFTKSIPIYTQVALGSVYFDYITANRYSLHGFFIERDEPFNLSSITLNYTATSDACSSGEVAGDSLCPRNSTTPRCIQPFTNPWIFNCSTYSTSTASPIFPLSNINDNGLISTIISSLLNSWQISLLCGSSLLFFLILLLLAGYFSRRHAHSKRIALSCEYLLDDKKSMQKSEIVHGQAFQRAVTIVEPKINNNTTISCIHDTVNKESYITLRAHGPYKQRIFIDHTKIHESFFPSIIPEESSGPKYIPNSHANILTRKVYSTTIIPRPICKTPTNRLKSITDGLEEHTLDESDNIVLDRSNTTNPKKPTEPKPTGNKSFADESLHDEDAWMSILAVANAELDMLDQLENDQTQIDTMM